MGYDIVTSDPFATGGAPGFKSKIFMGTQMDNDGRYKLDAGITASNMLECHKNEAATTVSNYREYKGKQILRCPSTRGN